MENQSGGGEMISDEVILPDNHPLHQPLSLNTNHQETLTLSDIERFLLSDYNDDNNTLLDHTLEIPFSVEHQPAMDPHGALSNNCEDANAVLIDGSENQKPINNRGKRQWTTQEDRKLLSLVSKHGAGKWTRIASEMEGRDRKQIYARWSNYLCPDVKKDQWSEEEEKVFMEAHQTLGNKWTEIAKRIPGRSENSIKNHWYATQRKITRKEITKSPTLQE